MDYNVRPWHLYSHSRTCIRSGLCRRPSRLVASLICYLLDHARVHDDFSSHDLIPLYVRHFQPLWRSWSIIYLHPLWRSWSFVYLHHGYSNICILYVEMTTYVISCIIPIHGHCTLMYPGLLYVFAVCTELYHCTMIIGWLVFHLGSFITPLLGWTYNLFLPSYDSFDLTH